MTTNNNIKIHKINPKAQTRSQLLGKVDLDTRQWIDGIISKAAQQAYSENLGKTQDIFNKLDLSIVKLLKEKIWIKKTN